MRSMASHTIPFNSDVASTVALNNVQLIQ